MAWPDQPNPTNHDALEHVPEKARPGLDPGWKPIFRKGHATDKSMSRKKPAPDWIRGGSRFSEKDMRLTNEFLQQGQWVRSVRFFGIHTLRHFVENRFGGICRMGAPMF
jgi:hypothetical protein